MKIYSLVYQPTPSVDEPPYHYTRIPAESLKLIAGHGIEGDQKAGKHPDRHLNIMTQEVLEALRTEGFKTNPGEMGEQIIISGLDINSLAPGTELQIGESARVVLNKARTGCDWFEKIQQKPRTDAANRMGMMASVIQDGVIRVGDTVKVLEPVR